MFPGVTAAVGGFLLLVSGNRATAMFGGWLAVIAGGWFVVGRTLASRLRLGDLGHPIGATDAKRAAIEIASFSGLGALIVLFGGAVLARVSARTARDVAFVPNAEPVPASYAYDAFTENAPTTVLAPSAPRKHRRKSKGGLFRRRSAGATSH